jgi:hypothetical protein
MMSDICKVSDGTRVVGKCLWNFLIPCFGSGCVYGNEEIYPKLCEVFFRATISQLEIPYYNLSPVFSPK